MTRNDKRTLRRKGEKLLRCEATFRGDVAALRSIGAPTVADDLNLIADELRALALDALAAGSTA